MTRKNSRKSAGHAEEGRGVVQCSGVVAKGVLDAPTHRWLHTLVSSIKLEPGLIGASVKRASEM